MLVAVTFALTMAAPLGSVTLPEMLPPTPARVAIVVANKNTTTNKKRTARLERRISRILSCKNLSTSAERVFLLSTGVNKLLQLSIN
jgi:hypothetical protein